MKLAYKNLLQGNEVEFFVSSSQTGFGASALRSDLISDILRFKIGWTIIAGINDRIDFNRGGVKFATIAPGVYVTGASLATAIKAALEAADAPPVWDVWYNSGTNHFWISAATAFTLLFGTGANKTRSIAIDLGYTETDKTGLNDYHAEEASYQSRHWVGIDLGTTDGFSITIVAGVNDEIRFGLGLTATVAPGFYASGTALAAAITTAMLAAWPSPWLVTFNVLTRTFTFSISGSGGGMTSLNFGTSTVPPSLHRAIGFRDFNYPAGPDSHTGSPVGGTPDPFDLVIVRSHNVSETGSIRFDAHATSLNATALGAAVDFTTPLLGDDPRADDFSSLMKRYARIVVDDVQNPTGFNELGVGFIGEGVPVPEYAPQLPGFVRANQQLSDISTSVGGTHQINRRRRRRVYTIRLKLFSQADEDLFDALDLAMPAGSNFFLIFDETDPSSIIYGFLIEGLKFEYQGGELRYVMMNFAEALE